QQLGLTDPMLRERVERLLRVDSDAEAELSRYSFGSDDPAVDITNRDPLRIVGRTVAQYRINNFLASGGMGVVYSADDLKLGRAVALKFPQPHQEVERTAKERFINEARSVATIDHPAVCSVYEIGESEFGIYLAMPLYPGETLKDRLA